MPDQPMTCQVRILGNKPCGRPLFDSGMCICHSEDPNKDRDLFKEEVRKELNRDDFHDFTSFVFPEDYDFSGREFKRDTYFALAKFLGNVRFGDATFSGEASFSNVTFSGEASFLMATFSGKASFHRATFSGEAGFLMATFSGDVDFCGATFSSEASFSNVTFSGEAYFTYATFSCEADFNWATFSGETYFTKATFASPTNFWGSHLTKTARVWFSNAERTEPMFGKDAAFRDLKIDDGAQLIFIHVGLENCSFLLTDVTKLKFTAVKWPRRRLFRWGPWFRQAVADELNPDQKNWELVGDIYRGLQDYYHEHNRYADAGDFYAAEQDVNRKTNRGRIYLVANSLYKSVSLYGQSYMLPLLWMALFLLLFPAIFLWGGIGPPVTADGAQDTTKVVSYSLSPYPSDCFLIQSSNDDYWTCFFNNVSFLTFNRAKLSERLLYPYQHALAGFEIVIMVALIAFFLLALRRQFKRKSF